MKAFRLDRSAFKAQTAEEAANHSPYYARLSWQQRLEIALYLNSVAYNFPLENPPKMDRSKFKVSSRG
ncbi:hypothetical protein [Sphingobacterium prati]|jgi:hypothetical protein|uniref:hypothetical protein n=1 Tax=Sphingobacterium TaxID=28453 RepID=UPI001554915C|nr:hypothetical protein [Sphingobacterium prati]NPE49175.1 hypothetical protein [Sphingobacterium prati]